MLWALLSCSEAIKLCKYDVTQLYLFSIFDAKKNPSEIVLNFFIGLQNPDVSKPWHWEIRKLDGRDKEDMDLGVSSRKEGP